MNIIVKTSGKGRCYCRPDTTWDRESKDIYIPEVTERIYWTPVLFARISKAGKCINGKFASRYYDGINFGVLLYTGEGDVAFTSCADHTSLLPAPLYNPIVMENNENTFIFYRNGEPVFSSGCSKEAVEDAICTSSETTSLRIGDHVAVELEAPRLLAEKKEGAVNLRSEFCGNELFDIKLII